MTAYNEQQLDYLTVQQEAMEALDQQAITREEFQKVQAAYPVSFYMPNLFIRIGLFLLTGVIILFAFGLFCLLFMSADPGVLGGLALLFAFAAYATLELLVIREKRHYHSGVDDALMWFSAMLLFGGICFLFNDFPAGTPLYTMLFVITGFFALRFANPVMTMLAFLSLLCIFFYTCLQWGAIGETIAPFVLMGVSFAAYFCARHVQHMTICRHYGHGIQLVAIISLVTGYLAVNYFIVREVGSYLLDKSLNPGDPIPAGWLFWLFTIIIPLLYIFFGIRKKDRILICTGLLLVAAISFTIRYYHSLLPLEIAMTLAGAALITTAYVLTRYLRQPRYGFTSEAPGASNDSESLQLEALAIAESFHQTPVPEADPFQFGGGSGGGGGATGNY